MTTIKFSRMWAMPNRDTFSIKPIREFVQEYLSKSKVSIDPFARNTRWATYTNDLNQETAAEYHMEAGDFLKMLKERGIVADLLLFDPPYSPRQLKECYDGIGKKMQMQDGQTARLCSEWRDLALPLLSPDAKVLSFGWNTVGFGDTLGFDIERIMLVCHGAGHNDTICVADTRRPDFQTDMFKPKSP